VALSEQWKEMLQTLDTNKSGYIDYTGKLKISCRVYCGVILEGVFLLGKIFDRGILDDRYK
jgi:hypothetical protein